MFEFDISILSILFVLLKSILFILVSVFFGFLCFYTDDPTPKRSTVITRRVVFGILETILFLLISGIVVIHLTV